MYTFGSSSLLRLWTHISNCLLDLSRPTAHPEINRFKFQPQNLVFLLWFVTSIKDIIPMSHQASFVEHLLLLYLPWYQVWELLSKCLPPIPFSVLTVSLFVPSLIVSHPGDNGSLLSTSSTSSWTLWSSFWSSLAKMKMQLRHSK